MLIMREIQPFDTLDFCDVLGITKEQFLKRIADIKNRRLNPGYSSYIFPVYLADISQHKSGIGILVLADRAILYIEAGKFV